MQWPARAHLYHDVWGALYRLQSEPGKYNLPSAKAVAPAGPIYHLRRDEYGGRVQIKQPSTPTPLAAWTDPTTSACITPDGPMPDELNGIALTSWYGVPTNPAGWETLAAQQQIVEPAFDAPPGYKKAAGVALREPDGCVWLVVPSNSSGNYRVTFPKGTMDGKSAQATALVEAFEESGLQVRLLRYLVDVKRTQSYTRYYLAERIAGNPADMGWESQAVLLVPQADLKRFLDSPYDQAIVDKLGTNQEPGWNQKA